MIPGQLEDVRVEVLLVLGYETPGPAGITFTGAAQNDKQPTGSCWRGGANLTTID